MMQPCRSYSCIEAFRDPNALIWRNITCMDALHQGNFLDDTKYNINPIIN